MVFLERCGCASQPSEEEQRRTLRVSNISKPTNLWQLEGLVSRYAEVEQCKMKLRTGELETLVTLRSAADAERVLKDQNELELILDGRVLTFAEFKDQPAKDPVLKEE